MSAPFHSQHCDDPVEVAIAPPPRLAGACTVKATDGLWHFVGDDDWTAAMMVHRHRYPTLCGVTVDEAPMFASAIACALCMAVANELELGDPLLVSP